MELVYIQVFLEEGRVLAWSSVRGPIEIGNTVWRQVFISAVFASESQARVLIHFIGDDDLVSDDERMSLFESAKRAGFSYSRILTSEPILEPDDAFSILALPFT